NGGFWDGKQEEEYDLLGSDYYVVALGNDADNISVAEKLRCLVGKAHLEKKAGAEKDHTVIAYAVFDSKVAEVLNQERLYACCTPEENDIYTYAFGSLDSVYSCDNVYMTQSRLLAEETGARYEKEHRASYLSDHKKRAENEDRNYSYWSNMAKALHVKYKIFSLGWIEKSVFDGVDAQKAEAKKQFLRYKKMALADGKGSVIFEGESEIPRLAEQKELLAWLEHRRWCAYTRAEGYRYTSETIKNLDLNEENHKNMPLKLHPCLVEAERPQGKPYRHPQVEALFVKGKSDEQVEKELDALENLPLDRLDRLSCLMRRQQLHRNIQTYDFKEFDRPAFDFDGYRLFSQMKKELKGYGVSSVEELFVSEENEDLSVFLKEEKEWDFFYPVLKVKEGLQRKYYVIEENDTVGFLFNHYGKREDWNKSVFIFEKSLFMTRFAFAVALLRHWKELVREIKRKKQEEKEKEKEDVSSETC
ncbi:MAG: hypothetical protein IKD18_01910, partial [Clostridia bacterium]|nr:hypothetical protein [Clostridia bacterium]